MACASRPVLEPGADPAPGPDAGEAQDPGAAAPGRLAVCIEDTGIGITTAGMARIFQPFEQGDLAGRHRFGGLGLGLSISKAIVDLHGGVLRAESAGLYQGATFTVELGTVAAPASAAADQAHSPTQAGPLRLLVVDDHAPTLSVLIRLLERDGHKVFPAACVSDALDVAAREECDAVISDLGLPDGSGHELMREIRRRYGWPGIALSGFGMEDDLRQSTEAGFSYHLVKPVDFAQLRRLLSTLPVPAQ